MTVFAQPSPTTDNVWIPRKDALNTLAKADSLPTYKLWVEALKVDVDTLNARIAVLKQTILSLNYKDENNAVIIKELENQKKIMETQKGILLDAIAQSNRKLKKQKRKTFFTALAGVAATVSALFL